MFTGRVVEVGTLVRTGEGLIINAAKTAGALEVGGSVDVNGVCLSAVEVGDTWFRADISEETAHRSTLSGLGVGARVNLELPLRVGDPVDGHLVQGHADAIGKVALVEDEGAGGRRIWIRPPRRFMDDVVGKGSVAVDGVSLAVAEALADRFSVALIPVTLRDTTLAALGRRGQGQPGSRHVCEIGPRAAIRPRNWWPADPSRRCRGPVSYGVESAWTRRPLSSRRAGP